MTGHGVGIKITVTSDFFKAVPVCSFSTDLWKIVPTQVDITHSMQAKGTTTPTNELGIFVLFHLSTKYRKRNQKTHYSYPYATEGK